MPSPRYQAHASKQTDRCHRPCQSSPTFQHTQLHEDSHHHHHPACRARNGNMNRSQVISVELCSKFHFEWYVIRAESNITFISLLRIVFGNGTPMRSVENGALAASPLFLLTLSSRTADSFTVEHFYSLRFLFYFRINFLHLSTESFHPSGWIFERFPGRLCERDARWK